jgi:beta-glucosidase
MLAFVSFSLFGQPANNTPWLNPDLPSEQRAKEIVSRMTLEEKALQMQNQAPAIERLGIPAYGWWNEALHGVARAGKATVFPQAIGLAATWDTGLMHRVADIISTEARAKYNEAQRQDNHGQYYGLTFWSPNINIFRDPRWGRGQETYGEDPFLTGRMGVAFIKGMQGDDPHYFKVIATAKHYAVHSGPEPIRHKFDVHPSERDLDDTYLPAFRAAVMEGKVDSIMCAYNSIDGFPACVNADLLQKRLKGEWGFNGYIVSDCGAIRDIFNETAHHYKPTAAEASAMAVKTGTDLTCGSEYRAGLPDAVKAGLITEAEIDRSVERLFVARFKLGTFDPPDRVPFNKIPYSEADSAEHRKVALEAASEAIVLLKNQDQTLPLKSSVKRIAVVGPSADDPVALMGNYNGFSSKEVTPLEGIETRFAGKAEIRFAPGATYTSQTQSLVPSMVLTPPSGTGHGLQAEYFDNADFQGEPKLRRVEPRVYQQSSVPDPAVTAVIPGRGSSVRWTGTLRAPGAGEYVIGGRGGFGPSAMRIFLDDKELLPTPAPQPTPQPAPAAGRGGRGAPPIPAHVQLEAGKAYNLRVEYKPQGPAGTAQLLWIPPAEALLAEAIEAVKNSDVAIVCVGLNPNLEGEEMQVNIPGFAGGDRTDLKLPDTQEKLLQAAISTGKPVVVVLTSGSAVSLNYASETAAAVLAAWYGGEETGTAIAETLDGSNNPGGRLPVTFYRGVEQLPPFEDYSMKNRTYRYFKSDPLYGFGFGLSYSTFRYSNLKTSRAADGGHISVRVKNESTHEGDEVVQLYVDGAGGADDPIRSLRGFERIHLRAGESRDVQFKLDPRDVPKAKTHFSVGGGQPVAQVQHVQGVL